MIHRTERFDLPQNKKQLFKIIEKNNRYSFINGGISINWRGNFISYLISIEKEFQTYTNEKLVELLKKYKYSGLRQAGDGGNCGGCPVLINKNLCYHV